MADTAEEAGCSLYTARRWSPGADRPEDDRCVNCGRDEAAHLGSAQPAGRS